MAAVLTDHTIIEWIAESGERVRLSGAKDTTALGPWLAQGDLADALSDAEIKAIFEGAARQWGEDYVGDTMDHAEVDLPLFILGDSVDDFRRRVEHFKSVCRRDRQGWLAIYTNALGWRWIAARRGSLKATLPFDPRITRAASFDLTLIVERPIPRAADHADSWKNSGGTGVGSVAVYPGPAFEGWPQFAFQGPGRLKLSYAGNVVDHPFTLTAAETMLINTDQARPTVRLTSGRNLWPLMKGARYEKPVPADEVTRVDITVTGGSTSTELWVICPQQYEGML